MATLASSKLQLATVRERLEKILKFLEPCLPLAKAHATHFITKNLWNTLLPAGIQKELLSMSREQLQCLPTEVYLGSKGKITVSEVSLYAHKTGANTANFDQISADVTASKDASREKLETLSGKFDNENKGSTLPYSTMADFFAEARECSLEETGLTVTAQDLLSFMDVNYGDMFIGTFMSEKKSHEVEVMSKVCSALARDTGCQLVVDFGSGKGYLSKNLSQQYQIPVLGIDASSTNTASATKRNVNLEKHWERLRRNKIIESKGLVLTKKEKKKMKQCFSETGQENLANVLFDHNSNASVQKNETERMLFQINGNLIPFSEKTNCSSIKTCDKNSQSSVSSKMKHKACQHTARFVPCTMFINMETDFLEIARGEFPELFSNSFAEDLQEEQVHCENTAVDLHLQLCSSTSGLIVCCEKDISTEVSDSIGNSNRGTVAETSTELPVLSVCESDSKKLTESSTEVHVPVLSCCESNNSCNRRECKVDADSLQTCHKTSKLHSESKPRIICKDQYSTENVKLMLTGLHTCGSLASTSLEVFVHNEQLRVLCNVGCCYNLLDEKYTSEETGTEIADGNRQNPGFPMSEILNRRQYQLGFIARNFAAQPVFRLADSGELQGERCYGRALLEVIIHDVCGKDCMLTSKLRRLEQKCHSIHEYIRRACIKLGISEKVSDEMINSYVEAYRADKEKLAAFFQLKTVLAPCIEALIILDRVAFLLEHAESCGINSVYLVKMFDPYISPRCYGIIAIKTK